MSPAAIPRIRSDRRDSRRTRPLPTHSQAARVAAITLATLIRAKSSRPSSKLRPEDSKAAADSACAPSNMRVMDVLKVAPASSNVAANSPALASRASCCPRATYTSSPREVSTPPVTDRDANSSHSLSNAASSDARNIRLSAASAAWFAPVSAEAASTRDRSPDATALASRRVLRFSARSSMTLVSSKAES